MTALAPLQTGSGGIIWITGYSASGKTTVGRLVTALLREKGVSVVFLDGDDLRSILASRWGYDLEDRLELGRVYFRLCNHLASQGFTVVISAVVMFSAVREWVAENIPNVVDIYLRVPEEERRRRDSKTKKIYEKTNVSSTGYEEPESPSLTLENFGDASPEANAERIVALHLARRAGTATDYGRHDYWQRTYASSTGVLEPSPFASHVARELPQPCRIVEVGCGNGRDAVYFATQGHSVVALDVSEAAIEQCQERHAKRGIDFRASTLGKVADTFARRFDAVYSRFVLHAMTLPEEIDMLHAAAKVLTDGGRLFIECRSIRDPMFYRGEVISPTERIYGHYRRFIVRGELEERITAAGFSISSSIESDGLAVFKDEDPVVIRVAAQKAAPAA